MHVHRCGFAPGGIGPRDVSNPMNVQGNALGGANYVGASLEVMARDAQRMRGERPFVFTNLKTGDGLAAVVRFVEERGMVGAR